MKRNAGYLYLLITFFCWGSIYVVSKYALAVMGPVTVSFCRYLVSVVCLYGILKWKGGHKKIAKEHWPYLLILGGLGYFAAIILQLGGTALLSGSLASLINSLNPVMISILAAVFLKEKITWKNVLSIVVSLIGVYIILGNGSMQINPLGILLSAGAVILWSAASVSIRKISGYYDPVQIALYGMCIALLFNIPAAVLENVFLTQSHPTAVALLACLFVAVFGWGVLGAAIATVIAQGFSAAYCLSVLRHIPDVRLTREDFHQQPAMSLRLLKLAAPLAIQNVIISVGGLTVQYVVNGFGFLFVAGFTAANKLYGVLEMASVSYGYAITTYVGQNLGAKKYRRIRNGVRSGVYMALITSIVIAGVMVITGRNILSLFVSGEAGQVKQVLDIAYKYLFIMAIFLWVLYLLYVYRSAIQGLGNTLIPLASGVVEFCMRVGVALLLPKLIGEDGIFYAEISAWSGAAILLIVSYVVIIRKYKE